MQMIAAAAPRAMPVRATDALHQVPVPLPVSPAVRMAQTQLAALVVLLALPLCLAFALGIERWTGAAALALALYSINTIWVAAAAATAFIGLLSLPDRAFRGIGPRPDARHPAPALRTAVLVLICGEPPEPFARRIESLWDDLRRHGMASSCDIVILSDTRDGPAARREDAALSSLVTRPGIAYRRRLANEGRKPGNIADWVTRHGADYDAVLVLDSDSRMTADRLAALIARMAANPRLGLIQTGIRLVPARSRFGHLQRLSSRLAGPSFVTGLAAWTGASGNYWGHNALIRLDAFADSARLPRLSGRAPFGGEILSHDFVEAAWMRRAGWAIEIDPETRGSFEDAPQDLETFHRRDRRWCQGNLQHLRILAARGLAPVSRLHLVAGIQSYLSAPFWLALVLLLTMGGADVDAPLPLFGALALLAVPKLCGLAHWLGRARGRARRRVILRAGLAELVLSSIVAPLVMMRQTRAVLAVLLGHDAGWKGPHGDRTRRLPVGAAECGLGLSLGLSGLLPAVPAGTILWLSPLVAPLLLAPIVHRWLDAPLRPARSGGRLPVTD